MGLLGSLSDWFNGSGRNYQQDSITLNVSGGQQIGIDTQSLLSRGQGIKERAQSLNAIGNQLREAAQNLHTICAALGQYLPGQWQQVANQLDGLADQAVIEQNHLADLAGKIQQAAQEYEQLEEHLMVEQKSGSGLLGLNWLFSDPHCSFNDKGEVICGPDYALRLSPMPDASKDNRYSLGATELIEQLKAVDRNPEHGQIRVLKHETNGKTSWTLLIPGTQDWSLRSKNPQDSTTNVQNFFGRTSDMTNLAAAALMKAGYKKGDPVALVGHSQGGAVAYRFAADKKLQKQFNVQSVFTLGSNIGVGRPQGNSRVLALENNADIVPGLVAKKDYQSSRFTRVKAVHADEAERRAQFTAQYKAQADKMHLNQDYGGIVSSMVGTGQLYKYYESEHNHDRYIKVAQALEKSDDVAYNRWNQHRIRSLNLGPTTKTTSSDFKLERKISAPRSEHGRVLGVFN